MEEITIIVSNELDGNKYDVFWYSDDFLQRFCTSKSTELIWRHCIDVIS